MLKQAKKPDFIGQVPEEQDLVFEISRQIDEGKIPEWFGKKIVKRKMEALRHIDPVAYRQMVAPFASDHALLSLWMETGDPKYLEELRAQSKWEARNAKRWVKQAQLADIGLKNERIKDLTAAFGLAFNISKQASNDFRKTAALMAMYALGGFTTAVVDNNLKKLAAKEIPEQLYQIDPRYEYIQELIEKNQIPATALIDEAIRYRKMLRRPRIKFRSPLQILPFEE